MNRYSFIMDVFLAIFANIAFGQVPQEINYQGVLKDASGNPVADGTYSITFRLFDAESGGNEQWSKNYPDVAAENGVFNVVLDDLSASFDETYWLEVEYDGNVFPRQKLTSVPYSLNSEKVMAKEASGNIFPASGSVGIGTTSPGSKFHVATAYGDFYAAVKNRTIEGRLPGYRRFPILKSALK